MVCLLLAFYKQLYMLCISLLISTALHYQSSVICTDSVPLGGAYFGMGGGAILLNNVRCRGIESSLLECNSNPIGQPDGCDHSEDAGVRCQGT